MEFSASYIRKLVHTTETMEDGCVLDKLEGPLRVCLPTIQPNPNLFNEAHQRPNIHSFDLPILAHPSLVSNPPAASIRHPASIESQPNLLTSPLGNAIR